MPELTIDLQSSGRSAGVCGNNSCVFRAAEPHSCCHLHHVSAPLQGMNLPRTGGIAVCFRHS